MSSVPAGERAGVTECTGAPWSTCTEPLARRTDGWADGRLLEKAPHSGGRQKSGRFSLPGLWSNRAGLGWAGRSHLAAGPGRPQKAFLAGLVAEQSSPHAPTPHPCGCWASFPHGRMVLPESQAHPLAQVPGRAWRPGLRSPTPLFAPGLLRAVRASPRPDVAWVGLPAQD